MPLLTPGQITALKNADANLETLGDQLQTVLNGLATAKRNNQLHPAFQALAEMKGGVDDVRAQVVRIEAKNDDNFRT